jgi:hypothetical protein
VKGRCAMKTMITVSSAVLVITACGTNPVQTSSSQSDVRVQERLVTQAVEKAPKWMFKLPQEAGVVYENGTAISSDFSMADQKAKTMAYTKICMAAGGKIRSQMKMYRADTDGASVEQSELTARSICPDVDISGVETVEMKHVAEGNRIRSYVLVALPIGSKNSVKSTKELQNRSTDAFKELDGLVLKPVTPKPEGAANEQKATAGTEQTVRAPAEPVNSVPIESKPISINKGISAGEGGGSSLVNPVKALGNGEVIVKDVDGTDKTVTLIKTDNTEYKQRREEALKKPGAVIGQITVQ